MRHPVKSSALKTIFSIVLLGNRSCVQNVACGAREISPFRSNISQYNFLNIQFQVRVMRLSAIKYF